MKTIVFFSLEDGWLGGVARVNQALQPNLEKTGFTVKNLFLRGCNYPLPPQEHNTVLRPRCPWEWIEGREILSALRKKKPFRAISLLFSRLWDEIRNAWDFHRARRYLLREKPDAIVVTSYLLLDAIPKKMLSRTLHHVHTSFDATMSQKANRKMLSRYNGKIGFLWLSRGICRAAEEAGFAPSFYLYNPLSHYPAERTRAEEKSRICIITRFSPEKRLPLAVELLRQAMDRVPEKAFRVEFWGTGPEEAALREACKGDERFILCGHTKTPFEPLKEARLTVNTSLFEGFSISVLEGAAAGVPTLAFRFGEAAEEEIESGKTGLLVPMDDKEAFVEALVWLLQDDNAVKEMSLCAREKAQRFTGRRIARDWRELLSRFPLDKRNKL